MRDQGGASTQGLGVALHIADRFAEALVVAALFLELALVLANVLARGFFHHSFLWTDEVARLNLSIMAFVGGAVAYRRREHAHVRLILGLLPPPAERLCLALADVIVLFATGLTGVVSVEFIVSNWSERTPILQVPESLIAVPLPLGMGLIAVFAADHFWRTHGKRALPAAAVFVLAVGAAAMTCGQWLPVFGDDGPIIVALALFVSSILAGVPVGFVLLLATAAYLWGSGTASLVVLPQNMVNGTGNYILLAIPFFILAGLVMERGGVSLRLIRFIQALVGHMRGGLLQVTIVSMYVISGLSGSKPADVAAVGTVMRDQLRERHGAAEGAAVLASAAIMGETVPPSIAMLIVGSITNVSVAAMFIGGIIPAAVIAVCLAALIHVRAGRARAPLLPRAPLGCRRQGRSWRRVADLDAGLSACRYPVGNCDADRGGGPGSRLRPISRDCRLSRDGASRPRAHHRRHCLAVRRAPFHIRSGLGLLLDADDRLCPATPRRPDWLDRQQRLGLHDRLYRAA